MFIGSLYNAFCHDKKMKRNNAYSDKEDVALYVMQYHELPPNFITKYGYEYLVNHNLEKSGYVMGGDTHINTGTLSSSDDATTSSSKSGCNGSVGAGMLGILGLGVAFVAIKKKKD